MKWPHKLFRFALLLPLFWWAYQIFFGNLGAEPAKELNHSTGLVALIYLVANLWIGIIWAFWKKWPSQLRFLLQARRFLGVVTFLYVCAHVFLYFALESFQKKGFIQVIEKNYLICGALAFLGMTVLAATSNDFSLKKLGGKKWKDLHRMVYIVMALVMAHIFQIEKADLLQFALITFPMWIGEIVRFARWLLKLRSAKPTAAPR
jgi:sulfoxide reductase heme-binding subunit YedZ